MLIRILLIFIVLISALASFAQAPFEKKTEGATDFASNEQEFLKVEQAYRVSPTIEGGALNFDWFIEPAYYLYQHQFRVEARDAASNETIALDFAPGKKKFDEFFNKELIVYYNSTRVSGKAPSLTPPYELKVTSQGCADAGLCYPPRNQYFSVAADGLIEETASAVFSDSVPSTSSGAGSEVGANAESSPFLPFVIFGAILGGLILNLMPCVFPVLSLKALSFTSSHMNTKNQRLHGWAYTAGVVGSFVAAALIILSARGAGESLGWGFQLQQPAFVAFMAYLFFVMGLSLSGLFHIGTSWMGAGQSLTSGGGMQSSFFTGVLAALVASPCTAPFMASALGFALTQPAYISLSIFAALGFGMALPFLLLSYIPALANYLPAPGPWMDTLKQVLAFPLYLTSVWLLWVLSNQTSTTGGMVVLAGGVLIAFGIWILQINANSSVGRWLVRGFAATSLVYAGYIGFNAGDYRNSDSGIWQPYSPSKLQELRASGTPVFVDLTADWCITCKFNERVALNTQQVAAFAAINDIVMLQGDWTNADPQISELLEQFGRSGVPLYLMYPAGSNKSPEVLPQILTEDIVLRSMERALL